VKFRNVKFDNISKLTLNEKVLKKKNLNMCEILNVNVQKMMNVTSGKFEAFLKFLQCRSKKMATYAGYVVCSYSVLLSCGTVRFLHDGVTA
jgi:hypothetical protein